SSGGTATVWDVSARKQVRVLDGGHKGEILSLAVSADGQTLAAGGEDWRIVLWDLKTGQQRGTLTGHTDTVSALAFTADGLTLVSGSWDQTARLWEVSTGQEVLTLTGHT